MFPPVVYLFNEGDECTNLTGGWVQYRASTSKSLPTLGVHSPYADGCYGGALFSQNKISLDGYTKLTTIKPASNYGGSLTIGLFSSKDESNRVVNLGGIGAGIGTKEYDISNYNDSYYIHISTTGGAGWTYLSKLSLSK